MRKLFLKTLVVLSFVSSGASFAATAINNVHIAYSRLLHPVDRQGFSIPQAIIGGKVNFEGEGPVYVTLKIGGQIYTTLTDSIGTFAFLAYTAHAGNYQVEAWIPAPTEEISETKRKVTTEILSLKD